MAVTRVTQFSYNSGEIGGLMYGRADDSKYSAGLATCQNALITPQGPLRNRAGFMYVAEVPNNKRMRLIPFTYSAEQTMVVGITAGKIYFYTNGQVLMDGNTPYSIDAPWREEDIFDIHYTQNADIMTLVHPSYPPQELRRYSMTDWRMVTVSLITSLTPPTNVTSTRLTSAASDGNSEKYTQTYVVTSLSEDRTEESEASEETTVTANLYATGTTVRVSWKTAPGAKYYRVYKLQGGIYGYIGETMETSIIDDNIAPETGQTPPYLDDVFQVSGGITNVEILNGGSGYKNGNRISSVLDHGRGSSDVYWGTVGGPGWNELSLPFPMNGYSFGTLHCDGVIDLEGNGTGATVSYKTSADEFGWQTILNSVTLTNDGGYGYVNPVVQFRWTSGTSDRLMATFQVYTLVEEVPISLNIVDSTGRGGEIGFSIENGSFTDAWVKSAGSGYTSPSVQVISPNGSGAQFKLTIGNAGDYPAAVGYFEQRRIFAGSRLRPQQIWMTATGTENNMTYHLPLQDTDRISFAVAAKDMNMIRHIVPLQQLIALTSAAEWRVSPLNSDAITPDSISVRPQSYIGASNVQPQMVNNNVLYAAARGGHVRELAYNYTAGGYITGDISIRASHLFDETDPITEMALTKSPDPILWCVKNSGSMLGLVYVPEQQIGAWVQYKTDGSFEAATVVQEGTEDFLYVVVNRTIDGVRKRFVERQQSRLDSSMGSGLFLDCAAQFRFTEATKEITGLTWLAGSEVTVVADGGVYKRVTVSDDGKVTIPRAAISGWVGLPYETIIRTLPVSFSIQDGSYGRGHTKNVNRVWMRVERTTGVEVGPDLDNMKPMKVRRDEAYGEAVSLQSGEIDVGSVGHWQRDGSFYIRQAEPAPFTLISHTAEIEIGG